MKHIATLILSFILSFSWAQNQLLLTNEMQAFIKRMGKDNKEFKVRSNID